MTQDIFALAKALGGLGDDTDEVLLRLCQAAEAGLTGRLKDGVTAEECEDAFLCASAWLALAGICAGRSTGETEAFTAGSLTIRQGAAGSQAKRADALRRQAELLMAPYTQCSGFCFMGAQG